MKAIPNKPRTIVLYRAFNANSTGSMTLTSADDSVIELTTGIRVRRKFAEFFIPEAYITEETLPLHVELKVNGEVIRIVELANSVPEEEEGSALIQVEHDALDGWPERPTLDINVTVHWYGPVTAGAPPEGLPGRDLWHVNNTQEVVDS